MTIATENFFEMHKQFQDFMLSKGYSIRVREGLISPIFPTTFTMSGGPDMAYKFWQGDKSLAGNQIVNQPCIRHWDIELTGDKKHLSFFNMFVADSISGFSRTEVITHFYEFFTKFLKMNPSKFYASYFAGGMIKGTYFDPDKKMKEIWQSLGIDSSKIIGFSDTDVMEAFVANSIEPVGGPRAELFYDLRETPQHIGSPQEFLRLEKDGKFLEFFTHVLYNVEVRPIEDSLLFKNMDREAIAAGFGPQRILRILEQVNDIGDISLFNDLKNCLGEDFKDFHKEMTIVCDHIRGLIFLTNDGILNLHGRKNNSRKYLFRKYLRNFKDNFNKLPIQNREEALNQLINKSIIMFGRLFPEFLERKDLITSEFIKVYNKRE